MAYNRRTGHLISAVTERSVKFSETIEKAPLTGARGVQSVRFQPSRINELQADVSSESGGIRLQ